MYWINHTKMLVVLSDAAIDEYMATLFINSLKGARNIGVAAEVFVNADCLAAPALQAGWKIREYLGLTDAMPLGLSAARGWNPFPWEYRTDCVALGNVPVLGSMPEHPGWPPYPDGDAQLCNYLEQCGVGEAVILCLCPITPLSDLLQRRPDLIDRIGGMVWMAGAIDVPGNLDKNTLPPAVWNPYAEWNVFWDPMGADWLLRNTVFPIVLAPLDVSDPIKVTPEFIARLKQQGAQGSKLSQLAFEAYSLVTDQPFYRLWDVTAAAAFYDMGLYNSETLRISAVASGEREGALVRDPCGREVTVLMSLKDQAAFYDLVATQFV